MRHTTLFRISYFFGNTTVVTCFHPPMIRFFIFSGLKQAIPCKFETFIVTSTNDGEVAKKVSESRTTEEALHNHSVIVGRVGKGKKFPIPRMEVKFPNPLAPTIDVV